MYGVLLKDLKLFPNNLSSNVLNSVLQFIIDRDVECHWKACAMFHLLTSPWTYKCLIGNFFFMFTYLSGPSVPVLGQFPHLEAGLLAA